MKNKNNFGITLMELLVVITIIGILAIGVTSINFNALNDKQKVEIFSNNVITKFEKIRNYAIIGKGIGVNLETPQKWKIDFSDSGDGNLSTYYSLDGTTWQNYESVIFENNYEIKEIKCLSIDETITGLVSGTGTIEITGSNLTLTGACNNPRYKKIRTTIKYKNNFEEILEINTINGLIETL